MYDESGKLTVVVTWYGLEDVFASKRKYDESGSCFWSYSVWIGGSIFSEEKYDKSHSVSSMAVCTSCSLARSHGRSHSMA